MPAREMLDRAFFGLPTDIRRCIFVDMIDHASQISALVRSRRVKLGLKQQELADLAGCSTRFIHTVEAGKPTLRLDKLLAVLDVLGLRLAITGPVE